MRSLTHSPEAVIDSPAEMLAAWPTVVTRSRCPRAFARSTQKPLSALWKVTRSTRPANASRGGDDEDGSGCRRIARRFRRPIPASRGDASKHTRPEFHSGEEKTSRPDGQAANQPSSAALADKRKSSRKGTRKSANETRVSVLRGSLPTERAVAAFPRPSSSGPRRGAPLCPDFFVGDVRGHPVTS